MRFSRVLFLLFLATWLRATSSQCPTHTSADDRPKPCTWKKRQTTDSFLDWLISGCKFPIHGQCPNLPSDRPTEYQGFDGWYNNLAVPSLGAIDTPLQRLLPAAYSDGVYKPVQRKVDPLDASKNLMDGDSGLYSKTGKTAFMVYFGQQVVEEILDAQGSSCPPEYINLEIRKNHTFRKEQRNLDEMPVHRTRYDTTSGFSPNNPRQQLNEITPYLDGGLVYGTSKGWSDVLRTFSDGTLAPMGKLAWHEHEQLGTDFPAGNTQGLPMANPPAPTNNTQYTSQGETANVERFFKLGNPRGNENPFLLTFGILWFRWHNKIAEYLHSKYKDTWKSDRIFLEARKWVIATYQSVVMYDWLPKFVGVPLPKYKGYNPSINPQVSQVFQSAAMRFGHTLVTSGGYLRERESEGCNHVSSLKLTPDEQKRGYSIGVRTCNSFWRSPELFTSDASNFERFLMGLSSQSSEREDHIVVEDLRGKVFGPLEFSRRDLMALNIQRGRDHGLPDYNTARKHFGLKELDSLEINEYKEKTGTQVDDKVLKELKKLYKNPSEVDIWPGGLLETTDGPGQLFSKIILNQFERSRDGDRFWFENEANGLFTAEERDRIRNVKIIDILLSVTNLIPGEDIQEDPFTAVHSNNSIGDKCLEKLNESVNCSLANWTEYTNGTVVKSSIETTCQYFTQLNNNNTEYCSRLETYDFFKGSEISYILTFAALATASLALICFLVIKSQPMRSPLRPPAEANVDDIANSHKAKERVATRETRDVIVILDTEMKRIHVKSQERHLLRTIDLKHVEKMTVKHLTNNTKIVYKIPNHYDLFLMFREKFHGEKLMNDIEEFCKQLKIELKKLKPETNATLYRNIETFYDRDKKLADFSKVVLSKAFEDIRKNTWLSNFNRKRSDYLLSMEITQVELANQLGMSPESLFVEQLFRMMDSDKNGFITIKEFWSVMAKFTKGSQEEKEKLIFDIYDVSQTGSITTDDLMRIIKSTLKCGGKTQDLDRIAERMLRSVPHDGESINYEDFKKMSQQSGVFKNIGFDFEKLKRMDSVSSLCDFNHINNKPTAEATRKEYEEDSKEVLTVEETKESLSTYSPIRTFYERMVNKIRSKEQYYFYQICYTLVTILIFVERAYVYYVEKEHGGLRRIAGIGVSFTRGAASAMMFTYSTLLLTMCRNLLSQLRSTVIYRFFPFDEMVAFHRFVGGWALFWTVIHVVGHAINFYNISTQTASDLTCLFRDYFRASHVLPKFHYWCWETMTGLTGVLLTVQTVVIYIFAYKARKYFFMWFWKTHNTYPLFYFLMILHGSGRLVQEPFFHLFFCGPMVLFSVDKLISMTRSKIEIDVISAVHLPSNVTLLRIRRPLGFQFMSGQWVKIASLKISGMEYHPFTLSSAPDDTDLTVHIREVGPWTRKIRKVYPDDRRKEKNYIYPSIYMDGPFGESHQMWWTYKVVIFIAGGIGVTPFSSILKDMAHKMKNSQSLVMTKKVIFLWVTKNQKQFEWMIDALTEVEAADTRGVIRTHIFITDFKSKYDLRTIMLYLAERHFQKISGSSLFTGLQAITHFGRPHFEHVFKTFRERYRNDNINVFGVFTCGPSSFSTAVDSACQSVNQDNPRGDPFFKHHYAKF